MAFDQGKNALFIRRNLKQICRELLVVHTSTQELLRENTALSLDFSIVQGSYAADPDAVAAITLLAQVQTFLQTNAAVITKSADLGDNIN